MTETLVFISLAIVLLAVFASLAIRRNQPVPRLEQAMAALRSLDVEAFRNLVSSEEEEFLRARLAPHQFVKIKRERARAALAYAKILSDASLQFARFGGAAQRSPDPVLAASGKEIANSAVYLRLRALDANVRLRFSALFPSLPLHPVRPLLEQYDRATYLMVKHSGLARSESRAS
jgi:hypothetical protein